MFSFLARKASPEKLKRLFMYAQVLFIQNIRNAEKHKFRFSSQQADFFSYRELFMSAGSQQVALFIEREPFLWLDSHDPIKNFAHFKVPNRDFGFCTITSKERYGGNRMKNLKKGMIEFLTVLIICAPLVHIANIMY